MPEDINLNFSTIDDQRRQTLKLLTAVPLAAMLSGRAFAADAQCCLQDIEIPARQSGHMIKASLAMPAKTPAPAIILIHEWWGLNQNIETMALELAAKQGFMALAIDLYDGQVATTAERASLLMQGIKVDEATDTCVSWIEWLKKHKQGTGQVATLGWCFGGGWSLNASIATPVDATVIYYGNVRKTAAELKALKGPVLGHFGTRDAYINRSMVQAFEAEMAKAGKALEVYWYEADHAFANPTGTNYDRDDAKLAWQRTTSFLNTTFGKGSSQPANQTR